MIEKNLLFRHAQQCSIDEILRLGVPKQYKEGDFLFREGEEPSHVFFIVSGTVSFTFHDADGKSFVLGIAPANSVVGELEMFDDDSRIAQALVLQDCEVLVLDRRECIRIFKNDSAILYQMLTYYAQELKYLMRFSLVMNVEKRLALAIIQLNSRFGKQTADGYDINLPLSQETLASMVGKPRQRINRLLKSWEESGWIRLSYRKIELLDHDALNAFASSLTE